MKFWNTNIEKKFFLQSLKNFASKEQLFYSVNGRNYAYIPKGDNAMGQALQSRNSLIGQFTEKWVRDFLEPIAREMGLFAVSNVVCPELGLTNQSDADLAFCESKLQEQKSEDIKIIFEVKMSIVNNYELRKDKVHFLGDFKTHKGTPSILRSDSMLKAIGKAINIRVSGVSSRRIPIIIIGNSPITNNYSKKVDFLKKSGVTQGFISLYPNPTEDGSFLRRTSSCGFQTFSEYSLLAQFIQNLVNSNFNFFSSMLPKQRLGSIIHQASVEKDDILRAEKFLYLLEQES